MFLEDLGRRLRERREARQLTQLDVASVLRVSPQAVSKWERGENAPDIALLVALSRVLGTTSDWLLGRHHPEGDEFEGTVFVSSIQGFTARSEGLQPEEVAIWANGFLRQVTEVALHEGGIPVKYVGDALLALFAGDDHGMRAVRAAISAHNVVTDQLVVGLASGPVYMAAIGHEAYARPDIMGPAVNKAFRVLGWAAAHGKTGIAAALSRDWQAPEGLHVVAHSGIALKGLASPIDILELAVGRASTGIARD